MQNKQTQEPLAWKDAPDFMTVPKAARVTNRHIRTIEKQIRKGYLPARLKSPTSRVRMISKSDLAASVGMVIIENGDAIPITFDNAPVRLTRLQAASILGLHVNKITRWVASGRIPIRDNDMINHFDLIEVAKRENLS